MPIEIDAQSIVRFHDSALEESHPAELPDGDPAWHQIAANHHFNHMLWDEEDRARRTDVPATAIASSKRLIDQYNQQRNDAVERIDEALLAALDRVVLQPGARLSSETAGAMIDRLSILSLKIFHMRQQSERVEAGTDHVLACRGRLERLMQQRADLASCLDRLLAEASDGRAYFKVYRQFKMYNDPALNPYLSGQHAREQQPGTR